MAHYQTNLDAPSAPLAAGRLPVLYSFRRCPYAMRARLAIAASGQACELREVVLRDRPPQLAEASPKATVPVLVDTDGTVIDESLDIMHWALERRDPHRWLVQDSAAREATEALVAHCDSSFKYHLDRYKYPERHGGANKATSRTGAAAFAAMLDARLARHTHLCGDHATLADMAIAPFVRQFAKVDEAWFDAQPWPYLRRWLHAWQSSPLLHYAMEKHAPWHAGDPVTVFGTLDATALAAGGH
jgi:glutathione S-transferase